MPNFYRIGPGNKSTSDLLYSIFIMVWSFFINFQQAIVVCKQLGFEGALKSVNNSPYGSVPRPFSYKGLSCTGSEVRLEDCPRFGSGECSARTGAGVVCYSHTTPEGKYDFKDWFTTRLVQTGFKIALTPGLLTHFKYKL